MRAKSSLSVAIDFSDSKKALVNWPVQDRAPQTEKGVQEHLNEHLDFTWCRFRGIVHVDYSHSTWRFGVGRSFLGWTHHFVGSHTQGRELEQHIWRTRSKIQREQDLCRVHGMWSVNINQMNLFTMTVHDIPTKQCHKTTQSGNIDTTLSRKSESVGMQFTKRGATRYLCLYIV